MAEPQGISRTFEDIAKGLVGAYQGFQGFRGEVGRNIGNVGRYFTSQAPVEGPPSAAMQAAADRQRAEIARLGGPAALQSAMTKGIREANIMREMGQAEPAATPRATGGGAPANPIDALFAPMFENLRKQRQQANKRYEANKDQVTNIYGQITGARSADIAATETAFKRLVDAAAARSTAVNTGIDAAEAQRLQQNQAALQSMGLEGLSTSQGDIASQTAAQAQQTNALNAANWQNMLGAMEDTARQQVQADIAGYNYAMLEDLGRLRGAREEFAQELGQQRGELKAQKAQATFEYQQAQQRAAAAAKEAKRRAKFAENKALAEQQAEALKASGPVIGTVDARIKSGLLDSASGSRVIDTISEWFINVPAPPVGKWNAGSATASLLATAGPSLSGPERAAIIEVFNKMRW